MLLQFRGKRRPDPDCCFCYAFMRHSWQCRLDWVVLKGWCQQYTCTHTKTAPGGKCIYHTEYVIVIQHEDASKPLFQNTLLFKASENSGATYWGLEHLWFNKFSEYHSLRSFFSILVIFPFKNSTRFNHNADAKKIVCLLVHCSISTCPRAPDFFSLLYL